MAGHARAASSRPHGVSPALPLRLHHEVSQAVRAEEIGHSVRNLIREICRSEDIDILQGHVRPDQAIIGDCLNVDRQECPLSCCSGSV